APPGRAGNRRPCRSGAGTRRRAWRRRPRGPCRRPGPRQCRALRRRRGRREFRSCSELATPARQPRPPWAAAAAAGRPPRRAGHHAAQWDRPRRTPGNILPSNAEREPTLRLSARNKISARVTGITHGEATANIELDANGVRLVASITVEAARELGLTEGTGVVAIVKASDVIIAVPD